MAKKRGRGRPKAKNPLGQRMLIRLDGATYRAVKDIGRIQGKTPAKVVREAIIDRMKYMGAL